MAHVRAASIRSLVCIGLIIAAFASRALATTVLPFSLGDMVRESETIIVGTIVTSQSRWLDEHRRVIVTDCQVGVEDVLSGSAPGPVKLTFWGGTIGSETQRIAGMPVPQAGERFVMFLRAGALGGDVAPTVGLYQGLLRVAADGTLSDAEGGSLRGPIAGVRAVNGRVRVSDFTSYVRANLDTLRATPVSAAQRAMAAGRSSSEPPLPRKTPAPLDAVAATGAVLGQLPAAAAFAAPPDTGAAPSVRAMTAEVAPPGRDTDYIWVDGVATTPIVINVLPDSFAPWSPVDQYMQNSWNFYADIFRKKATPTGTYLWGDGVFDFAGFPTSADLQYMYGRGWAANEIGVTFIREVNNRIVEADVALRNDVAWTLDDESVYAGVTSAYSYRQAIFHEFGHTWGARHYNGSLAQMGYSWYSDPRGNTTPYTDDAEGIRNAYGGTARTDLSIQLFRWNSKFTYGGTEWFDTALATFPSSIRTNNDFTIGNFTLSNSGTTTISAPTVEWYLAPQRNFNGAYYYVGSTTYPSLARFTKFTETLITASVHVPSYVPTGSYFIGAFIRDDESDPVGAFPWDNSRAFTRERIFVQSCSLSISPTSATVSGFGATSTVSVTENAGCGWTATSNASWITVTNGSGSGPGSFGFQAAANINGGSRTGTIGIGPLTFTVNQYAAPKSPANDFDGDHKADMVIYKGDGLWAILKSSSGYTAATMVSWGGAGYTPVAGDYDGDGRIDPAVYEAASGRWSVLTSSSNYAASITQSWGGVGYLPEPGDYDGDGKTDPAVYVQSTGWWYVKTSSSGYTATMNANWGGSIYIAVPGTDFDGDRRSDMVVYHEASGNWYVLKSTTNYLQAFVMQWGGHGYTLVPADYDGDGKTDFGAYHRGDGFWYVLTSTSNYGSSISFNWGGLGYDPVPGDYDADGRTDPAITQRSSGNWYALKSSSNYTATVFAAGWSGGNPIAATVRAGVTDDLLRSTDVDADGRADITVYHVASGVWYELTSSSNYTAAANPTLGGPDDLPAAGDFDGDGRADPSVYRPSTGAWSVMLSSAPTPLLSKTLGGATSVPVAGDYDGDGRTDMAVYNTVTGTWSILKSSSNFAATLSINWGGAGYVPVPADFDGDGKTDLGVYYGASGTWSVLLSKAGYTTTLSKNLGGAGYVPVPGDYDGDGRADVVVYNTTTGLWYGLKSGSAFTTTINIGWGGTGYDPVRGDFDGDGLQDIAVYVSASGLWYVRLSSSGYASVLSKGWGGTGYTPIQQ